MKIFFYKSAFCPRCFITGRELANLQEQFPRLEIEEIDVLLSPVRTWKDGIKAIPAIRYGEEVITGFILKKEQIIRILQRA